MRMKTRLGAICAGLALSASPAGAEQYNVIASAGNNGDSHTSNSDPDAFADFSRTELGGEENYTASANANGGSLHASAARAGTLSPATVTTRSAARIEETIHIDELPSGPVTITASIGVDLGATAVGGFASASYSLDLDGGTGSCRAAAQAHSVQGLQDLSSCSALVGSSGGGSVSITLTPQQLQDRLFQIDIEAQVDANFENVTAGFEGAAHASGGAGLLALGPRGTEPVPSIVSVVLDPPLAHSYTGSMTSFPVLAPEPAAPLLLGVGAVVLRGARARSRRA